LLERIRLEFEPQARAKGLRLRVKRCRAVVHSDPALLERILRNLVSNAVRYTARGRVVVGCRRAGDLLRIQVLDTGVGIDPAEHALVFEEFYQAGNPERDRRNGLGLGLSIVQRLARLLGSSVRLASAPGQGSVFEVALPLASAAQATDPSRAIAPAGDGLQGRLVVVVDDDAVVLDATGALLRQGGCDVVCAASGGEAKARLAAVSRPPDALVCDYRLRPPDNGLLVMEMLREEFNRQIPTLIITGDVLPESAELAALPDVVVLHKPVAEAALRDTLARLAALGAAEPLA
jgi:CheY-like chemotaxis protein/anti-sigma regulatory factor (Ser/Thr protein kinase)